MTQTAPAVTNAPPQTSLIKSMADKYGLEAGSFKSTIIKTLFPSDKQSPTNEQVAAFLVVADKYDLDPFRREIYAFPAKGGGIVPIVSIDGWISVMNRNPAFDGIDFTDALDKDGKIESVTATLYRKDRSHPTIVTEYLKECKKNTEPWSQFPSRMLRHKALMQAVRYAFGMSGVHDEDEGREIALGRSNTASTEQPKQLEAERISEDQRTALVELAKEMNVVEDLGSLINSLGFEMIAFITVDRYDEVVEAIKSHGSIDGTVEDVSEPPAAPAEVEAPLPASEISPLESRRANVKAQIDELEPSARKRVIAGKKSPDASSEQELDILQKLVDGERGR